MHESSVLDPILALALIAIAGTGAQWLAWRLNLPAIVLMLLAGFLVGPVFGILSPHDLLGANMEPFVAAAVSLILFEGALSLNLHELRREKFPLARLIGAGVPIAWFLGSVTAWAIAGLSWQISVFVGALLIVTGPTVIVPMLREAKIERRPATILKWEGILNDPLGVLLAVFAFEMARYAADPLASLAHVSGWMALIIAVATAAGFVFAWICAQALRRGFVPEHLKMPFTFSMVLACFAAGAALEQEAGLLAVTVMGVTLANYTLPALDEMRRFKETVSVLLVSGIFIILTASLTWEQISGFDWRILAFAVAVMFVVRPLTVFLVTLGSDLTWQQKVFLGWIAPRGIVVFTIAGVFAAKLTDAGFEDASMLVPLAFGFVVLTVVVHGGTVGFLARTLGLEASSRSSVLIVGANPFSAALARALADRDVPVCVADTDWQRLRQARKLNVPVFHGEVLSDQAEQKLDLNRFDYVIAASHNTAYNALVSTDLAPRLGREYIYQIAVQDDLEANEGRMQLPIGLLGQALFPDGAHYEELERRMASGWRFTMSEITEETDIEDLYNDEGEAVVGIAPDGTLTFVPGVPRKPLNAGDCLLRFVPPADSPSQNKI